MRVLSKMLDWTGWVMDGYPSDCYEKIILFRQKYQNFIRELSKTT